MPSSRGKPWTDAEDFDLVVAMTRLLEYHCSRGKGVIFIPKQLEPKYRVEGHAYQQYATFVLADMARADPERALRTGDAIFQHFQTLQEALAGGKLQCGSVRQVLRRYNEYIASLVLRRGSALPPGVAKTPSPAPSVRAVATSRVLDRAQLPVIEDAGAAALLWCLWVQSSAELCHRRQ